MVSCWLRRTPTTCLLLPMNLAILHLAGRRRVPTALRLAIMVSCWLRRTPTTCLLLPMNLVILRPAGRRRAPTACLQLQMCIAVLHHAARRAPNASRPDMLMRIGGLRKVWGVMGSVHVCRELIHRCLVCKLDHILPHLLCKCTLWFSRVEIYEGFKGFGPTIRIVEFVPDKHELEAKPICARPV